MATAKTTPAKTIKKKPTKKAEEVKTLDQIKEDLAKLRQDHLDSRKSHRQGELVNPHVLTTQRKQIARALTAINKAKKEEK